MRFRMFNLEDVAETTNRETVAVTINVSRKPFPQVPALERWERDYHENPWSHYIYAHWVLMDENGERLYGALSCQCIELMALHSPYIQGHRDLKRAIANYKRARDLRDAAAADPAKCAELEAHLAAVQAEIEQGRMCDTDMRFLTIRNLLDFGGSTWDEVLAELIPPAPGKEDPLLPGVRTLAIRALAELVADDSPFDPRLADHVKNMYRLISAKERNQIFAQVAARTKGREPTLQDLPVPPSLRRRAAHSLGLVIGRPWAADDPQLIEKARRWWGDHRDDEAYLAVR